MVFFPVLGGPEPRGPAGLRLSSALSPQRHLRHPRTPKIKFGSCDSDAYVLAWLPRWLFVLLLRTFCISSSSCKEIGSYYEAGVQELPPPFPCY